MRRDTTIIKAIRVQAQYHSRHLSHHFKEHKKNHRHQITSQEVTW
jgi:hypothetical protein